jgi:hypothetical protein
MLRWIVRFLRHGLTLPCAISMARIALNTNRKLKRGKYSPIRIGHTVVPRF